MSNSKIIGNQIENEVEKYLIAKGYKIEERNFHCLYGEIDIIASKSNLLTAVEVKKYPNNWDPYDISYKVNYKKKINIKKTLSLYLAEKKVTKYDIIRFDVAIFTDKIQIIEGAF